ncbi:hypothetical protein [Gorillibacterium sp. sgz5001074]|uniref:hypothetical protein n=1 Tax=Gorillibacterium sp. sgz5001074 TaxID=3446695 RepID=UPI003F66A857
MTGKDSMMDQAKDWAKDGLDVVQDTGDVIGDTAKAAAKSIGQGASAIAGNVTDAAKKK